MEMNVNQFSDLLTDIIKRSESAFSFHLPSQQSQEQYDPKIAIKMALICVNGNMEELLMDILEIITFFLIRGPKISKVNNENVKETGKKRLDILKQKYKLKDFASNEEIANGKALSLKKLIPAFPYQLLILMKNKKYDRPLGKDVLKEANASDFPDFLKSTSFLSVIPFPSEICRKSVWPTGKEGIKKFLVVIYGVIAYAYLESFVLHKWGNNSAILVPAKALWSVINVTQNILNSDFINHEGREDNFESMFKKDLNNNFVAIENLIRYTENKYPGFKEILECHFNYNVKIMKFHCKAKMFCRHRER